MLLSVDIGGTAVKLALADENGALHARHEKPVHPEISPLITQVLDAAEAFLHRENAVIDGIAISATGQIDDRQGIVIGTNGKIPHYEGTNLREAFEGRFHVPTASLNDANAAVLGECFRGRAQGVRNVVMVTLGTGVGGGVVVDGRLLRGVRGIAGELGHLTLYQDGEPCPCGKRGCLETYASATALTRAASQATGIPLNGRAVFARAAQGDAACLQAIDRWLDDVAAGLTGLTHLFNPEMLLIGGGVSAQEELLMKPLRARVLSGVMPRFAEGLSVERAMLGNDAGMIGAVKFFLDRRENA